MIPETGPFRRCEIKKGFVDLKLSGCLGVYAHLATKHEPHKPQKSEDSIQHSKLSKLEIKRVGSHSPDP